MRDSATLAAVSYQGESDRALNTQGRWLSWPESRRGHEASASTGKVCPFVTSLLSMSDERRTLIQGALTSLATQRAPSPCGLRRTLCAPGKPIRRP